MKLTVLLMFIITLLLNLCSAYKILVVFPNTSKSHGILGEGYVRHLLNAGHEITYIASVPMKNSSKNLRQIDVSSNFKAFNELMETVDSKEMFSSRTPWNLMLQLLNIQYRNIENTIGNEDVQKLLYDPNETFDAVIIEWLSVEIYAGFAAVFNCPLIWASPTEPNGPLLSLIDEAPNPAYTPDNVYSAGPPFTFLERVTQLAASHIFSLIQWFTSGVDEALFEANFAAAIRERGRTPLTLKEVKYNASMILANSHVSTGVGIRLPQNYKAISGYHVNEEVSPLPEKLEKLMNESKNGVIYFSLGSIVPSNKLPEEMRKAFIEVFRSLKQTVIWKFDMEIPDLPKNIHVVKWAPQQSILAHPKCILFITHGGLLSVIETVHYGKPIIGIPVFADQFSNVKRAVQKGFALELRLNEKLAETLKNSVQEMISNTKYTERVKEVSYIYHHRLVKPGAELVHWVEHVIHTKGAPELQSPALHMPWYQKAYLDLVAVLILLTYVIVRTIKFLCCSRRKTDVRKKKN
ncbi:hypothetical protein K1T71_012096 [Dendrolimus kikuchii]|uniref:Uncharacterized protein n=1 Tax=Dendrolimus kikuchii TaxID=765133 RepID=A0ACC1CKQ9_9NEOP|nr:hypothetical protein K1T71_012096 [Dendrolimus kikuchii]